MKTVKGETRSAGSNGALPRSFPRRNGLFQERKDESCIWNSNHVSIRFVGACEYERLNQHCLLVFLPPCHPCPTWMSHDIPNLVVSMLKVTAGTEHRAGLRTIQILRRVARHPFHVQRVLKHGPGGLQGTSAFRTPSSAINVDKDLQDTNRMPTKRRPGEQPNHVNIQPSASSSASTADRHAAVSNSHSRPPRPCRAWKAGACSRGAKCWFAHDPEVRRPVQN